MQIPLEILAEIACFCPVEIWTFASVCRQWRYATLLYAKCWSCIHINSEEPKGQDRLGYRLGLWVERGGQSPLELRLQGPFHRLILSEPLVGCLSRIHTLHIDAWPSECDEQLESIVFPQLETLSVVASTSQPQISLARVSAAFWGDSHKSEGQTPTKAPHLRQLALAGVYLHLASLPKLGTLKLQDCVIASSSALLGLLDKVRQSLKTLCLQNITKLSTWPPAREDRLSNVEFLSLASLTLMATGASRVLALEILPRLSSPTLTRLTCDDPFLSLMDPNRFPILSHLSVHSLHSSSLQSYQKMFKKFSIVSLTIYRDPGARCGLNVLLWSLTQDPDFAKTLRRLRYLTSQKTLVRGFLDTLNKERSKSLSLPKDTVFASQNVLYRDQDAYEMPWGEFCFYEVSKGIY